MAARLLVLEVVTPERVVAVEQAESIILPAANGYLGVLPGHAPLVAALEIGIVSYGEERGPKKKIAVSGGFAEVAADRVTVLADTAELSQEIDVLRAKAAQERALGRLTDKSAEIDYQRARTALLRALNRLRAVDVSEKG
ncbi:MAG: F0F1 ATP synthase subunit epsilon [Firmicutes bacterium]|nr:F0F1 ATP synthase subunit epsilon [Bacillota bacterium]